MEYLADTVTLIRYFTDTGKIGNKAKTVLMEADMGKNTIYISIISFVEILYLSERNKIKINLEDIESIILNSTNYGIVDLNLEIVKESRNVKLKDLHDRLIVSTAKNLNLPILTSDREIKSAEIIETVWT